VITQLAVYGFDEHTKRMQVVSLHPGVTLEDVQANSEFPILAPAHVPVTEPPSPEERRLLREIDPRGIVLGR
jgi:glutaconate CoA-transferase subunit B